MATLQQARAALKTTMVSYFAGQGVSVQVYDTVPGQPATPAVIVEPASGQYHATFGANARTDHTLSLHCIVALGDREAAQNTLDQMISETGALSVVAAVHTDRSLGGVVSYADPLGYRDYGTRDMGGVAFLMATVDVAIL